MKTAEEILKVKGTEIVSVESGSTIFEAIQLMNEKNIGSVVIMKSGEILGLWTERHLKNAILMEDFDIHKSIIDEYMNKNLDIVTADEPIYLLSDKLLGKKIRYLFVGKNNKIIGLLSAGDVIRACLIERTHQLQDIGLEYYESWKHN
ncbi:MAG: CBS domain-containing protein [Candidatus Marinimicrobia bacterium]|nr:CBS domain-containing protein [Candidatus Neomarinimicrobiota bacterium]